MPQSISIDVAEHLGPMAVRLPGAARVFARHHLDFCCGGARSLKSACEKAHLDPDLVIKEIEAATRSVADLDLDLTTLPLDVVIEHIMQLHHEPLHEEFARLHSLGEVVARVHGDSDARLHTVAVVLDTLIAELEEHMHKEEHVLFPWICSGQGRSAGGPIAVMHQEHERCGELLAELHDLTDGFVPSARACNKHRALLAGLAELDTDLRLHMHKENTVLFPRALAEGLHPSGW